MNEIATEVDQLIEAVKQSKTFQEYDKQRNLINEDAELKQRINKYREEVFRLQNSCDDNNIHAKMNEFAERNAEFLEDIRVSAYLDAENNLCRMLQELTSSVIESLEFE
ncbi:MAG: YlbF family regulator [Lachnospiraceae bacterium]|nr:YlbF family regulator [Lachnospiraceae bacterium]